MYRPPNEVTPKLTPNELFERRVQRDKSRLHTYNQILEQIHTRIYSASQLDNHPAYVMYTVPPFVLGLPKIDLQDCIVYVVYQLRQSGFQVRYTYPNLLYISWEHHEKEYLLHQNPIIQAMIPDKKKKGVGFALPGPIEQQVATVPRKLVQTMERPQADKKNSVLQDLWMFS